MSDSLSPLEREASNWLTRVERGLTPAEQREFEEWLAGDSRRASMVAGMCQAWRGLDALRGTPQAAALGVEVTEYRRWRDRRAGRWRAGRAVLAAAACVALAATVWWGSRPPEPGERPATTVHATAIGEVLDVRLPDGSRVKLNTQSRLEVDFREGERRLHLVRGEAFFAVTKDPKRPFVVTSGRVDVRAIGTEFNVRRYADALEVLVREGRVRVARAEPAGATAPAGSEPDQLLDAGQKVRVTLDDPFRAADQVAAVEVPSPEIDATLAWQKGKLVFNSSPLTEIVAEFNRRTAIPLVVADPALASRHFGGTFVANNPETLIELLASTYDVAVERRRDAIVLRLKP